MRCFAPFAVSLLLPLASLVAQEKFTLRYDLKPGPATWTEMTQEMTQNMSMAGKDMKMNMTTTMWLEGTVKEVKDGIATVEQRYARIKAKSDNPMMKVDYDSAVEGSKPGAMRSLADLVGQTAKSRVDSSGKVLEFTPPAGGDKAVAATGANLKQAFEQQFTAWPKEPIAIGSTWQSNLDIPMEQMGTMKATITNKLIAVKDGVATVEQAMAMDTSGLKMPGEMKLEVPKAGGTAQIALHCFQPVLATMDMEMKMIGPKDSPMTMTMGMHMTMKQVPAPAAKPADAAKGGNKN